MWDSGSRFPDQGLNRHPLHWKVNSQPLGHKGSPLGVCLIPITRALSALGWERNWFYLSCFPLSQAHRASSVLVVRYLMREWNDSQLQVVLGKNGGRLSLIWPLQTGVNEICNHAGGLTWDGLVGTAAMGNSLWCFPYRAIFQYSSTISHAMGLKKPRMNNQGMEMRRIK